MDLLKIGLVAGVLATAATPALAAPQVSSAWSRPAAAGTTGAGFMMLTNPGKAPDALVAVESPAARSVEIHRSVMSGGVSSMRKQARVPLAPGGSVLFAPGGITSGVERLFQARHRDHRQPEPFPPSGLRWLIGASPHVRLSRHSCLHRSWQGRFTLARNDTGSHKNKAAVPRTSERIT